MENAQGLRYFFNDRWHELSPQEQEMAMRSCQDLSEYIVDKGPALRMDILTDEDDDHQARMCRQVEKRRAGALDTHTKWTPLEVAILCGMTPVSGLYLAAIELGKSVEQAMAKLRSIHGGDVLWAVWPRPLEEWVLELDRQGVSRSRVALSLERDLPAVAGLYRRLRAEGRMPYTKKTK